MPLVDTHEIEALAADLRARVAAVPPEKVAQTLQLFEETLKDVRDTVSVVRQMAVDGLVVVEKLKAAFK